MKLGVVGGTFDPVHVGHIAMAEAAAGCAGLDRVLLIPSASPPHRGPARAGAEDRLEMCRLAATGHPLLEVSGLEVARPGPSYTVDTLSNLRRRRPTDELFLILGWDAARELQSWHRPDRVLELAGLVIVPRPGLTDPSRQDLVRAGLNPDRVVVCSVRTPAVDATEIRERVGSGQSLDGLVDPAVADHIAARGLYLASDGA